ncbi:hypothetical protein AVEN_110779-1 [Araneus ventricosus]|uniref:PiggyBac transposable element-derived protein domain-containing protein n=1 Tax=Araneus ventricosus TaxID=182803 RepID=A0A4Y2L122_ARAVE|nr:hypothetical protein AVEN_110779-1 [Araneus ventricosus]
MYPDASPVDYCAFGMFTRDLSKPKSAMIDELWKIVADEWKSIPLEILRKALLSWKLRCRLIVQKKGYQMKHFLKTSLCNLDINYLYEPDGAPLRPRRLRPVEPERNVVEQESVEPLSPFLDVSAPDVNENETEIDWSCKAEHILIEDNHKIRTSGPVHDLPVGSSPFDYFKLLFSTSICETIMININKLIMLSNKNLETTVSKRIGSISTAISCPGVAENYNKSMGGVDLADQKRQYYDVARKSRKWWIYLFWFLLNSALDNAHILYLLIYMPDLQKGERLFHFKLKLIENMTAKMTHGIKRSIGSPDLSHKRIKIEGRKKCRRRCSKLKLKTVGNNSIQSSWMCTTCQVCLCVDCYGQHHNENNQNQSAAL